MLEGDASKQKNIENEEALEGAKGRVIACRKCEHPITTSQARIDVNGAHWHTFANPQGFVYHIGCFATAPGTIHLGDASTYFAWFTGYSWQVVACRGCGTHLGWLFRSARHRFHGLILDRLTEIESQNE